MSGKLVKENKKGDLILLEYGVWYDISLYFKNKDKLDWVLVQFKEKDSDFYPLSRVCTYIKYDDGLDGPWITADYNPHTGVGKEEVKNINERYTPIAFMLWKPFDEASICNQEENLKEDCDEHCIETNKSLKDDYNVYGSKLTDVEEIKKLRAKCGKLTTLVGQLTYELFEEKLDDIIKEKILDERKD